MQRPEMAEHQFVNIVMDRRLLINRLIDFESIRNAQPGKRHLTQIPDGHRSFTSTVHHHVAVVVHSGHGLIAAGKFRPTRDVLRVAVGEIGHHQELLLRSGT